MRSSSCKKRVVRRLVLATASLITPYLLGLTGVSVAQESLEELLKQGASLSQKGDYAAAVSALKKAREFAPRNYSVNLLLGVSLLRSGLPKEALELLQLATEINPQDGAPYAYMGKALAAMNEFSLATDAFQSAISRSPRSEEVWVDWADFDLERFRMLALRQRSTQKGMAAVLRVSAEGLDSGIEAREVLLQQSALANPEQPGIWGELGAAQLRRGMREEAAASLKMALEQQPRASWTQQLEAMTAAAQGDWLDAEKILLMLGGRSRSELRKAILSWPQDLVPPKDVPGGIWQCANNRSTDCLDKITLPDDPVSTEEEELFSEERWEHLAALPTPSNRPSSYFRRGVALAEMDDCGQAIVALEHGLEAGGETAAFWLEICYSSEAERAVARVVAFGNEAVVHRLRGDILVRIKGDTQSATAEYTKAALLRPQDPGLHERLAQAYFSSGDMQKAQLAARKALSIDPNRALALHLLASISINERDYSRALVFLNQMLAMHPNDGWTRVQMGIAYAQTGKPQQALDHLQPVLAGGYPDERGALHAALAGVLRKLGREKEALIAADEAGRLSDLFQQHALQNVDDRQ
jgi:tetratricopeptide (TPR) repeat protein